jgi:hypothetical protein
MTLSELLPLLSPLALAALEAGITDSLDETLPDDGYQKLLAVSAAIRVQGHSLWGEDYAYLSGSVSEYIDNLPLRLPNSLYYLT